MKLTRKRVVVGVTVLLFAGGILTVVGVALDWPSPRRLALYGLPGGGPTGRTFTNNLGMEFVEISAGYYRTGSHCACKPGDFLGGLLARFRIGGGRPPRHNPAGLLCPPEWIEVPRKFWISRHPVRVGALARFRGTEGPVEHPEYYAISMSFEEAEAFCDWLWNGEEGRFRLPTESEWEYVFRGGERAPVEDGFGTWRALANLPIRPADEPHPWGIAGLRSPFREWCDEPWDRPCRNAGPGFLTREFPGAPTKMLRSTDDLRGRFRASPRAAYRGATFRVVFEPKE